METINEGLDSVARFYTNIGLDEPYLRGMATFGVALVAISWYRETEMTEYTTLIMAGILGGVAFAVI